ncbi:MAG TPA: CHASE2 domain-containing protein [Leptolyngbyaceae cyanobacterium M33_DOE_097]|nr:CHASE2 domain-containing protein [Leptolyngbyaceae cyanobacterium M33_DOE_097]
MTPELWKKLSAELKVWRVGALSGLGAIGLVSLMRFAGVLQPLEWAAFDRLMRVRPPEPRDERILIIGLNETDIQKIRQYPVPDRVLAQLIKQLEKHQPRAIGLDIVRDIPVEPGHQELAQVFRTQDNLFAIQRVQPDSQGYLVQPPPDIPVERVGFIDSLLDEDGYTRRRTFGLHNAKTGEFQFSFAFLLAEQYLLSQGYSLESGVIDPYAIRFGAVEFPRLDANTGAYVRTGVDGVESLLNFRSGKSPFRILSFQQVLAGQFDPNWVRDRIVLVGITASSVKDVVNSAAIPSKNPGLVNGVEVVAHDISQMISAVLDKRPLLQSWADGWEYGWIVGWGILGVAIGRFGRSPWRSLLVLAVAGASLVGICYGLLLVGWWVPLVPPLLVLTINAVGPAAAQFYRYEQDLRDRLRDRQLLIEHTFNTIHNGPLQTLSRMMRETASQPTEQPKLASDLHLLNQELRSLYETMRQEALSQSGSLRLGHDQSINLQAPLHEILFQVYDATLQREFPGFQSLKVKIVKFEPMGDQPLSIEQKRGLCRFLEEALCNVGKHAQHPTRLTVTCATEGEQQVIRVADNGAPLPEKQPEQSKTSKPSGGFGSQQAQAIAKQVRGQFRRYPNQPKGTVCELTWKPTPWYRFW